MVSRLQDAQVSRAHDSDTFWKEAKDLIHKHWMADLLGRIKQSPWISLAIDEKDTKLCAVLSFLDVTAGWSVRTVHLAYKQLHGLKAQDVADVIQRIFDDHGISFSRLLCFTADGASVMGTMRAMAADSPDGKSVAARLCEKAGHALWITRCAAHRLQLFVRDAHSAVPYLKDLERNVNR